MKIYTRTGDTGETSLFGGTRVGKDNPRVAAYGDVDELNAHLGLARTNAPDSEIGNELVRLQRDLFALGARLEAGLPALTNFILAGGSPCGAALHVARAVCRRAERHMVALEPALDPLLLKYINRLSDLLFVLARAANQRAGVPESVW